MRHARILIAFACTLCLVACGDESKERPPGLADGGTTTRTGVDPAASPSTVLTAKAEMGKKAAAPGEESVGPLSADEAYTGYGQVTLYNQTSMTLDLYVGEAYGCRALRNLMCTTQVQAGTHTISARGPGGESVSALITLESGDSLTWTVTEE